MPCRHSRKSWAGHLEMLGMALLLVASACEKGSGNRAPGGLRNAGVGDLQLLDHQPPDLAVQVPLDKPIILSFDAAVHPDAMNLDEFTLKTAKGLSIPGVFTTDSSGRAVHFQPLVELSRSEDYVFTLSPMICDRSFRSLDEEIVFGFRTYDTTPPRMTSTSIDTMLGSAPRSGSYLIEFDERLSPASIHENQITLMDEFKNSYPLDVSCEGTTLTVSLVQDLPGSRAMELVIKAGPGGIKDRSGNPLAKDGKIAFTTEVDTLAPVLVDMDPINMASNVSPRSRLEYRFTESMDPDSFEPSGLQLRDSFHNDIPYSIDFSRDLRFIRLLPKSPMVTGRSYTLTFIAGPTGVTDVSGNALSSGLSLPFTVGSDVSGPTLIASSPANNAARVSPNASFHLVFDENVKWHSFTQDSVHLSDGTRNIPLNIGFISTREALITTLTQLEIKSNYILTLEGGYDGIKDDAGNPMDRDVSVRFSTSDSSILPSFLVSPASNAVAVPTSSRVTAIANEPMDPASVDPSKFLVKDELDNNIPGSVLLERGNRVLVFEPNAGLPARSILDVVISGGAHGIRLANGNWLSKDLHFTFRTGIGADTRAPDLELTIDDIAQKRNKKLSVPQHGFTISISAFDPGDDAIDLSSIELELKGPEESPGNDDLFAMAIFSAGRADLRLSEEDRLPLGSYELVGRVKDLSGNWSKRVHFEFDVITASVVRRPFERTQVVWVRTDLDRDNQGRGNGKIDFDEDLVNHGFMSEGDPIGANKRLRKIILDGILAVANYSFNREGNGARKQGFVNIRLTSRRPCNGTYMRIALGGLDPRGPPGRKFGSDSTGILGRAFFDYRNGIPNEDDTLVKPGLGVFSGEMFLFQAKLYLDLWPFFLTPWGRDFRGLSPHIGGKPAGTHVFDRTVLAEDFDYDSATPNEKARFDEIFEAADAFAVATGSILAHEIGHTVGLVARGSAPAGLHGDGTLHNEFAQIGDLMNSIISYQSLQSTTFTFRALNLAYLREHILIR